jgi:SAM-dependent methyltransferase
MQLPEQLFRRHDESSDSQFYLQPRFVTHIEDTTIEGVTQLYRELLPSDGSGSLLDLMSSWVSHLPAEMSFEHVAGLGMNERELEANPRLTDFVVRDLNSQPTLPYDDGTFDAIMCCVSVQYLTQPIEVMRDAARVARSGAPIIITFSNRCFPTKAVMAWQMLDDNGHLELVESYLKSAGGWNDIEKLNRTPRGSREPLLAVVARRS